VIGAEDIEDEDSVAEGAVEAIVSTVHWLRGKFFVLGLSAVRKQIFLFRLHTLSSVTDSMHMPEWLAAPSFPGGRLSKRFDGSRRGAGVQVGFGLEPGSSNRER